MKRLIPLMLFIIAATNSALYAHYEEIGRTVHTQNRNQKKRTTADHHKEGRNKWRQTGHWRHPRWYDKGYGWRGRYGFRSGFKYGCDPENPWCEYQTISETKAGIAATSAAAHANEEFEAEKALETNPVEKQTED